MILYQIPLIRSFQSIRQLGGIVLRQLCVSVALAIRF